jgi:acyl-CoA thioesterase-1
MVILPFCVSFRPKLLKTQWRYLPLGDSYTIGTGAAEKESWPCLLAAHLNKEEIPCRILTNPARNGFTTQDLIEQELPLVNKLRPNLVTLLIGVNDWVQEVPKELFEKNLVKILDEVQSVLTDKQKVILITIPDFGVTPQGKRYGRGRNISQGISGFNSLIRQQAQRRRLPLVDIFELSQKMGADPSLVAADGLHPSAKEYAIWEKKISEEVIKQLK